MVDSYFLAYMAIWC